MKYEGGDALIRNIGVPGTDAATFAGNLLTNLGGSSTELKTTLDSELNLPWMLSLGASYHLTPELRAEANYVRFGWSNFKELALDFPNNALDQSLVFDYKNAWALRFGAEYAFTPAVDVMVGYVHDKTPQLQKLSRGSGPLASVSPILPDSDRDDYSVGLRWKGDTVDVTFSWMVVVGKERTNIEDGQPVRVSDTYPVGTYKSMANVLALGLGYHF